MRGFIDSKGETVIPFIYSDASVFKEGLARVTLGNKNGYINGFAIAGSNKKFVWAKAYLDGNDIIVYNTTIKEPVAIRYNWGNSPDGNLFNKEELPAPPFRTDNW